MPIFKRKDVAKIVQDIDRGDMPPVYLLFGERYLCQEIANELVQKLLPDETKRATGLISIDGDHEDPLKTLNLLRTFSLFSGPQIIKVADTKLFYSKGVAKALWDKAKRAFSAKESPLARKYIAQMLCLANVSPAEWLTEDIAAISGSRWQSLFGFAKPQDVGWVKDVLDEREMPVEAAGREEKGDAADLFVKAFEAGIPPGNVLILMAEAVDKRKRFYKYLVKHGVVIDLAVDSGGTSAARKGQEAVLKELVQKTLAGFHKKMEPKALAHLLERVGFHPVAAVMETEKLALYVGEAATITTADLNALVGRTREEALYEITEAFGNGNLNEALGILHRIREKNVHPLAIVSSLRNYLEKLLLARAFQEQSRPSYSRGMAFPLFQKGYLPNLKESRTQWPEQLAGHPYVVYKMFRQAEKFSLTWLKSALEELLAAEFRLKGSSLPDVTVIENFLFRTMLGDGLQKSLSAQNRS